MNSPASLAQLQDIDRAYHLHPFTNHQTMHQQGTHVIVGGDGCFVIDGSGQRLLDGLAGLWCVNVGYSCQEICDAVYAQMQQLPYYCSFFNSTTEPAIRLAQRLAQLAPPRLNHTIFANSGSEANETAIKLIRSYYKLRGQPYKTKLISRTYAYHGVTVATTSLTGLPTNTTPFDLPLPGSGYVQVPGPYSYAANAEADPEAFGQQCIEATIRTIEQEDPRTIAAMFVEPIQGAGGVVMPPEGYLKALRQVCRDYDILFVADEVITGFGRLGDWFASGLWELDPDLMTMAKGLTSGYLPLSATMVSDELAEVLLAGGLLAHGYTYSAHPASTAAALANLDVIEKRGLIPRVKQEIGPYFQHRLQELAQHPAVGEVRGYGLIAGIELLPPGGKAALTPELMLGAKATTLARAAGLIVRGIRNMIALSPPLIITTEEVDVMISALQKTLEAL